MKMMPCSKRGRLVEIEINFRWFTGFRIGAINLLFFPSFSPFTPSLLSDSVMPSAVKKQNRKPSAQKPKVTPTPQPSAVTPSPSASSTSTESPAAKQVLKSTEPQAELIVYNVQLEDDGSPAQSKTVRCCSLSSSSILQTFLEETPRTFYFADRTLIDLWTLHL